MPEVTELDLSQTPEAVGDLDVDCLLVILKEGGQPPFESQILRSMDWKLLGQLTRAVIKPANANQSLTFIPTMKKIRAPYVAIQTERTAFSKFYDNCSGMQLNKVGIVAEKGVALSPKNWEGSNAPDIPSTLLKLVESSKINS